jgi:two-component system sensor histidine kinase CreC
MVDMANLLAELAADDVTAGQISTGRFARAVNQALDREPRATIFGVDKASVDLRVYMTDAHGIVTYDSEGSAVNADYSHWRDVERVLHGGYGPAARAGTRRIPAPRSCMSPRRSSPTAASLASSRSRSP